MDSELFAPLEDMKGQVLEGWAERSGEAPNPGDDAGTYMCLLRDRIFSDCGARYEGEKVLKSFDWLYVFRNPTRYVPFRAPACFV